MSELLKVMQMVRKLSDSAIREGRDIAEKSEKRTRAFIRKVDEGCAEAPQCVGTKFAGTKIAGTKIAGTKVNSVNPKNISKSPQVYLRTRA